MFFKPTADPPGRLISPLSVSSFTFFKPTADLAGRLISLLSGLALAPITARLGQPACAAQGRRPR
jgi:hypothetical protein